MRTPAEIRAERAANGLRWHDCHACGHPSQVARVGGDPRPLPCASCHPAPVWRLAVPTDRRLSLTGEAPLPRAISPVTFVMFERVTSRVGAVWSQEEP